MSLSDIDVDTSDGMVDFRIPVIESRTLENGEALLTLGGMLLGKPAKVVFRLAAGMLPNDLMVEDVVINAHPDAIRMSLDGEDGHNFAAGIGHFYGSPQLPFRIPHSLTFTAVALSGDPNKIDSEIVKFKLFHETGSTNDEEGPAYFEMFLNIDLPSAFVYLNEKDNDFRSGVLNALQETMDREVD